jgi:hypothetical protein
MHCVFPPFEPPDGGHPRFFCLVVVGGTQLRGSWYLSAIVRLQGFSSGSPAAFPHQWAIWWREASRAAASAPPSALRIFVIWAEAEERTEWGVASAWVGDPFLPASGGGNHPPALQRRRPPAMPGKANYCCPARMQHSVLCPRFRGEDGSEGLSVRFGVACACWCGVGRMSPSVLTWWQLEKASLPTRLPTPPAPPGLRPLTRMAGSRPSRARALQP